MGLAHMRELYIINEIKEGVSILLRLFIDDCVVSLKNLNLGVF
jgi:hypothetical protein